MILMNRRDTLFRGGCGRFFEGTPEEMHAALSYLGTLPDATVLYDGHEYTKGNAAFAKSVSKASRITAPNSQIPSNRSNRMPQVSTVSSNW